MSMRSQENRFASLSAAAMLAALANSQPAESLRRESVRMVYKPKMDTPLDREIAEWNASVDRRKADKKR